jgi:hypothetical protein
VAEGVEVVEVVETTLAETTLTETVVEVMAELAELEDSKTRAVNEKHGDNHGCRATRCGGAPPVVDHQDRRAVVAPRTQPLCPDDHRIQPPAWRAPAVGRPRWRDLTMQSFGSTDAWP